jgi:lipoate-protein ligase A
MTMLSVANNYKVWKAMTERKEQGEPKVRVEDCNSIYKFFKGGMGKWRSWSVAGKLYCNDMFDKIVEGRKLRGNAQGVMVGRRMMPLERREIGW